MGNSATKPKISSEIQYCQEMGHNTVYRLSLDDKTFTYYARSSKSKEHSMLLLKNEVLQLLSKISYDMEHIEDIIEDEDFSD